MRLNGPTRALLIATTVAALACLATAWVGVLLHSWRLMVVYVSAETLLWVVTFLTARRRLSALLRGDISAVLADADIEYTPPARINRMADPKADEQ